jgi:hypothetical protein
MKSSTVSLQRAMVARLNPDARKKWRDANREYREAIRWQEYGDRYNEQLTKLLSHIVRSQTLLNAIETKNTEAAIASLHAATKDPDAALQRAIDWLHKECPLVCAIRGMPIPPKPEFQKRATWDEDAPGYRELRYGDDHEAQLAREQNEFEEKLLRIEEAGLITDFQLLSALELTRSTYDKWIERGLPFRTFEGYQCFNPAAVNAWIKANTKSPKRLWVVPLH